MHSLSFSLHVFPFLLMFGIYYTSHLLLLPSIVGAAWRTGGGTSSWWRPTPPMLCTAVRIWARKEGLREKVTEAARADAEEEEGACEEEEEAVCFLPCCFNWMICNCFNLFNACVCSCCACGLTQELSMSAYVSNQM